MRMKDRIAVVTGAASGFGAETARVFAREGAKVVVADLNEEGAKAVAAEIGDSAVGVRADVANRADVKAMIDTAVERFGGFDTLVNNAGFTHVNQPMMDVTEEDFDRCYSVNVKSIYLAALEAVPHFRKRGGGNIINVASTAGVRPRPGLTWYNGSKGAAIVTSKSMAVELGPENIRVNAICPVIGETGMLERFMGVPDTPENRKKFLATIPLGRMSRPADVANAALYLASDEAEFISGVALEVDGARCV
ncbi:4-formylbenzenesulfonate dehydrogenase TsaC1/TsaC2 [wastewater metagenome]|uniref:4-formylbenzenesulfonate dehydrogenase TsaC1/TsaC2 n=2 Tax=unclassified sequences TaxID=12908 RepID=A0A5B8RHJ1_9ZZZZ|nr:glucose 1-dehydrogenase [Arhodomonas sp. KWT]QEA07378.1 4-formylbenzenesulfonate dehydrogenase TsaC1/TsaC2 [uncultured organism]